MPRRRRKTKKPDPKKFKACSNLITMNDISNSLQPLCYCKARDLVLGKGAIVCTVCDLYDPTEFVLNDLFVAEIVGDVDYDWDDDESIYDVIKEYESEYEDDEDDFEDDDEVSSEKKSKKSKEELSSEGEDGRRKPPKKIIERDEDEEDDEIEEDEDVGISEELFGGSDDDEDIEVLEVEDETQEADELFEDDTIKDDDVDLDYVEELDQLKEIEEEMGFTEDDDDDDDDDTSNAAPALDKVPDIKELDNGKQRCPFCHKEYKSVLRHIGHCKKAPPGGAEALKKKYK